MLGVKLDLISVDATESPVRGNKNSLKVKSVGAHTCIKHQKSAYLILYTMQLSIYKELSQ